MLAEQVRSGKLPPVEQRLPAEPMVIKPLRSIGAYGGTWRRGFLGPGDGENGNRLRAADKPLFFDLAGTGLAPNLAKGFEISPDGRRTTLFLRRGMKWSDGAPFTADDFMFWFDDIYQDKDLAPAPAPEMSINGKPGRMLRIDEATVAFEFEEPYFLFPSLLASDSSVGGGQSRRQSEGSAYGLYAPAHYLRRFLPRYADPAALAAEVKAAGFATWKQLYAARSDWRLNPELPTVAAFRLVQPINRGTWMLERNPYFYEVDTSGNQLPYIDRVQMQLAETPELINLRALAGEYDYMERFIDLAKLPVFLENADRYGYRVLLDSSLNGADTALFFNLSYRQDPEIAKWIGTADFRRALSLGIDREQLNELFWLGLGSPGSVAPDPSVAESPGAEWRTRWSTLDPVRANAMLDGIGLSRRDRAGFRVRTDNGERLRLQIDVPQTLSPTWPQQMEAVVRNWQAIGIAAEVKVLERTLFYARARSDQVQIGVSGNTGTESLFLYPVAALPIDPITAWMGAGYSKWYVTKGETGLEPRDAELLRAYTLFRSAGGLTEQERVRAAQEIWRIAVDQQWAVGLVGISPAFMGIRVVSNALENVPARTCISQQCRTPWSARPEQWYFRPYTVSR